MSKPSAEIADRHADEATAERLIRRLARRYLCVLAAVAVLVIIDQAVIQPLLVHLNVYAPVINTAGRQRMLSQKLTKAALALVAARDAGSRRLRRDELRTTAESWSAAHAALRQGDRRLELVSIDSPAIARELAALQPQFDLINAAALAIVAQTSGDEPMASDLPTRTHVDTMLRYEADYLQRMDHVVTLLEAAAGYEIVRLRLAALIVATTVIALLVGLGLAVVRPATRTIRAQVDQLESCVALRTQELAEAVLDLRREMAQREQAESKTQQLSLQLAHAARVSTLGHLAGGLAHELNQPLGTIANYAETCDLLLSRDRFQAAPLARHLAQIKQAAVRAGQIVRRMRDFVRPQQQPPQAADLNALVREVAELCQAEAERSGVQLTLELAAGTSEVHVDPIQIQQVLVNLAQNAFQAMLNCPRGERRLCIRTQAVESRLLVDVIDCGPGIAAEVLPSLFTPFCTTKPDGLGIGLAICRSIVERHGGEIWAQPPSGRGATISFTLPCGIESRNAGPGKLQTPDPDSEGNYQAHADGICCR